MRKIVQKYQQASQKTEQIRQAAAKLPPRLTEIRETIAATVSQARQIHATLQAAMEGLRADDETMLNRVLAELNDGAGTLREAGLEMEGVEWELGLPPKLIVHLRRVDHLDLSALQPLLAATEKRPAIHALLATLVKEVEMAEKVKLPGQVFSGLTVYAGTTPAVRLRWRAEGKRAVAPAAVPVAMPPPAESAFTQSRYFEPRSAPANPAPATPKTLPPPATAPAAPAIPAPSEAQPDAKAAPKADWRQNALDRFKKMPDLTKYRR